MNKISGVYKITNTITGDFYIGSSRDIRDRWVKHKSPSRWAYCSNSKLYKDMAQFGVASFKFEIIEETDNLKEREQYYIEQLKPNYNSVRAKGWDIERYRESNRLRGRLWAQSHKEECQARCKAYYDSHKDEQLTKIKAKQSRLCLYEGKTLTLGSLSSKFSRSGIAHPTLEAKKYLITGESK